MTDIALECESCGAEFDIRHGMDSNRYKVTICPFCGDELDEDVFDVIAYDDDDDDEYFIDERR